MAMWCVLLQLALVAAVCAGCLTNQAFAQTPRTQSLDFSPGLVRLDPPSTVGDNHFWMIYPPVEFMTDSEGSMGFAACQTNRVYVVHCLSVDFDSREVKQQQYTVRITGNGPTPPEPIDPVDPVEPDPPAPPGPPDFDHGKFGLAKMVYDLSVKLDAADRTHALPLSQNFGAVAAAISASVHREISKAEKDLQERNSSIPGIDRQAWGPVLFEVFTKFSEANPTLDDYKFAFREIETGLIAAHVPTLPQTRLLK